MEFKVGQTVNYNGETWEVLSVKFKTYEGDRILLGRLVLIENSNTMQVDPVIAIVKAEEIVGIEPALTAKEYAEKLKKALGYENCKNIDGADPEDEVCAGLNLCGKCPFFTENRKEIFGGSCEALMIYHPDIAVKLMDEWQTKKEKPKGKTYLQDFLEKMPGAFIDIHTGNPACCRKRVYNGVAKTDCRPGRTECIKCWNEVMPEVDNAEG